MNTIKLAAQFEKTEELKREIRESPEYKKAMLLESRNQMLTPVSSIVRHQAASVDNVVITVQIPRTPQSLSPTLLRSSPPSCASPSRWSRPAFPSHFPSSRSPLSSPVSPTHPCCLAPLRSAPLLESPSSRRSVSSQLSSARLSSSQSPASLRCPPSPSKQYN